jgi:hypothetical protein
MRKTLIASTFHLFVLLVPLTAQDRSGERDRLTSARFIGVPLVNYNRSFEFIIGGVAGVHYPISASDTVSPPSMTGGGGFYATNYTHAFMAFAKLYYAEDRWRTYAFTMAGKLNFQYYNWEAGVDNAFIDYTTLANAFVVTQLMRVSESWYGGVDFSWFRASTTFDVPGGVSDTRPYVSLGAAGEYDTRPSKNYPRRGWYLTARLRRYADWLGSASEFTKLKLEFNRYMTVDSISVLAFRGSIQAALGSVPFEAQTVVGGKDIRGYSEGKYRGDQVYALQGEYRWNFSPPFGAVGFAGLAVAVIAGQPLSLDDVLPGIGAGFRYTMIREINANVGMDIAVGREDWGLYFRIAEAF